MSLSNILTSCSACLLASEKNADNKIRSKPLIYIVDSYNIESFPWTNEIRQGIISGLKSRGYNNDKDYTIVSDKIDAYVNNTPKLMKIQADRILSDIDARKPDIVITTDDDALEYVGLYIDKLPVVFNGVNGDPKKYLDSDKLDSIGQPGHNITGVFQKSYFKQTLSLMKKMLPDAKTFAVLTDETTTSYLLLDSLRKLAGDHPLAMKEIVVSKCLAEWKHKLTKEWPGKVDAVYILSANAVDEEKGRLLTSEETINWILDNSTIPDMANWGYQVGSGILLSATDDGVKQGEYTSHHVAAILNGKPPGRLPIVSPKNGVPALNFQRMKKLGLKIPNDLLNLFIENGVVFK